MNKINKWIKNWIFFDLHQCIDVVDQILEYYLNQVYDEITIVAFSSGCPMVVSSLINLMRSDLIRFPTNYSLHLVDPPNMLPFHDLPKFSRKINSNFLLDPSFRPLLFRLNEENEKENEKEKDKKESKNKSIRSKSKSKKNKKHSLDFIYKTPAWLFKVLSCPVIRHVAIPIVNAFHRLSVCVSLDKNKRYDETYDHVDHCIMKLGQTRLQYMVEKALLSSSPFHLYTAFLSLSFFMQRKYEKVQTDISEIEEDKEKEEEKEKEKEKKVKIHFYTGTRSKYRNYVELLSERSPFFKMHMIEDVGHHVLLSTNFVLY
jgi:hypothetical protein